MPALQPALDRPFAFFGHSMGGLVAFEVARRLREQGQSPVHLFVSASRAPQLVREDRPIHVLPDHEFMDELRRLNGTPEEVLEHGELMGLLLPMIRADFTALETYRHVPGPPLDCPITALGGADDPSVGRTELQAWQRQTRAAFTLHLFPGDHFYLNSAEPAVLALVARALAPVADVPAADADESPGWNPPPATWRLDQDEVHVWRAALDLPAATLAALRGTLAADEQERAGRFHFAHDRDHFTAARGILRALLGRYLDRNPAQLEFSYGPVGKPVLAPAWAADWRFNVSHSGGIALYAFARGREVGVDVERVRPEYPGEPVARRFFSPAEVAALAAVPPDRRREAFFLCWTRKEAYIKATGRGLSQPLERFDVELTPGRPAALLAHRDEPAEAARWSMRNVDPGPGYAGALAVEGHGWRLWRGDWPAA